MIANPFKKRVDGKLDRRYKANRGLKQDGTPDRRYKATRLAEAHGLPLQGKEAALIRATVNADFADIPDSSVSVYDHSIKSDLMMFDELGVKRYAIIHAGEEFDMPFPKLERLLREIQAKYDKAWKAGSEGGEVEGSPIVRFKVTRSPSRGMQVIDFDKSFFNGAEDIGFDISEILYYGNRKKGYI